MRKTLIAIAAVGGTLLWTVGGAALLRTDRDSDQDSNASPIEAPAPKPEPDPKRIGVHQQAAFPVEVEVPAVDISAPVVPLGLTDGGALEWGLPFFRGLAALLVQVGTLEDDETMVVVSEPRGWLPRDPNFPVGRVVRFKRVREGG